MKNGENMLIAKPIVKNQYWVVTNGKEKVGNVTATDSGFELKLQGGTSTFDSTKNLQRLTNIEFQPDALKTKKDVSFSQYPTPAKVFNSMLDIKRKLHLFTKTTKSKCYYVAGWFLVQQGSIYEPIFCPKYIFIQRYKYSGPYKTKAEATINIR